MRLFNIGVVCAALLIPRISAAQAQAHDDDPVRHGAAWGAAIGAAGMMALARQSVDWCGIGCEADGSEIIALLPGALIGALVGWIADKDAGKTRREGQRFHARIGPTVMHSWFDSPMSDGTYPSAGISATFRAVEILSGFFVRRRVRPSYYDAWYGPTTVPGKLNCARASGRTELGYVYGSNVEIELTRNLMLVPALRATHARGARRHQRRRRNPMAVLIFRVRRSGAATVPGGLSARSTPRPDSPTSRSRLRRRAVSRSAPFHRPAP